MRPGSPDPPESPRPGVRLADAVRIGVSGLIEEITIFLVANLAWATLVGGVVYAVGRWPIALLLVPVIAPLTCGLARVAVEAARGRFVGISTFLAGIGDRFWAKLGLGAIQGLVLTMAIVNLVLAPAIGGLPAVAAVILSVYVVIGAMAYGLVFWTMLSDPQLGSMPVRGVGRLALAVVLRRPLQIGFLLAYAVLAAGVMTTLIVPLLFLPSLVLLTVAAYVVPAGEEVRGVR